MASDAANRYARALIESQELSVAQGLRTAFQELVSMFHEQTDFRTVLVNPRIPLSTRVSVAREVSGRLCGEMSPLSNLVGLLVENGRPNMLPEVFEAFSEMLDEITKNLSLEVTSAFDVPQEERQELEANLRKQFGTEVRTKWRTDSSLIGGIRIRIGDKVLDNSVRSALDAARNDLLG